MSDYQETGANFVELNYFAHLERYIGFICESANTELTTHEIYKRMNKCTMAGRHTESQIKLALCRMEKHGTIKRVDFGEYFSKNVWVDTEETRKRLKTAKPSSVYARASRIQFIENELDEIAYNLNTMHTEATAAIANIHKELNTIVQEDEDTTSRGREVK